MTKKKKIIIGVIVIVAILAIIGSMGGESENTNSDSSGSSTQTEQKINYKSITVAKLEKELDENAASASDKYKDKYVALKGKLGTIDSDGDYFSLDADEYDILGVHCYIQDDKQLDKVKKMKKGDLLIVKGKITDVGEVLGYSLDIDSLKKAK